VVQVQKGRQSRRKDELRKDETAAGQTYKYARVAKVHVGTDGKVRASDVEYKVPGEAQFHVTTRPVHKLLLIIPVEEQVIEESGEKKKALEPESRNQDEEIDDGVREEQGVRTSEAESAVGVKQPYVGGFSKESEEDAQHKKVGSPKGARKCPPPAVVKVSEGEEEIVDVGVIPKRGRGRPEKSNKVNSLDPHKGSVTTIRRECAWILGKGMPFWGREGPATQE
jgi:hypothetical protein